MGIRICLKKTKYITYDKVIFIEMQKLEYILNIIKTNKTWKINLKKKMICLDKH